MVKPPPFYFSSSHSLPQNVFCVYPLCCIFLLECKLYTSIGFYLFSSLLPLSTSIYWVINKYLLKKGKGIILYLNSTCSTLPLIGPVSNLHALDIILHHPLLYDTINSKGCHIVPDSHPCRCPKKIRIHIHKLTIQETKAQS